MRLIWSAVIIASSCASAPIGDPSPPAPSTPPDATNSAGPPEPLLSNTRQLIFEGKRSGEGYFSRTGNEIVFQSEREPDNPFYQIYRLDLQTGNTSRVSPGYGKTTCAWIHPEGDRVLFASTHDDPAARDKMKAELDFRASGKSRRYSWDYDQHYELYEKRDGADGFRRLTRAKGYDAEGSWSPDGRFIVFASNRRAYDGSMTEEDRTRFERDPAYMIDIYLMKADGSDVRRLTDSPGYDGGPFFSPDGERITWRRFSEDGHQAEIWTMNVDGSDQRQLTKLGHMSWAPFYHPSGEYLIFTTNLHGFDNFELYIVDAEGAKKPVRVTRTPGFDGLPVFSPDGQKLLWSSTRTEDKRSQLFFADWNHSEAQRRLALATGRDEVAYHKEAASAPANIGGTSPEIRVEDLERHVGRLVSEEMGGRMTGTEGEANATAYVASAFEAMGLSPAGTDGFFFPFEFTSGVSMKGPNVLVVEAAGETSRPEPNEVWRPLAFSKPGSIGRAPIAFAGYGVVAQKSDDMAAYDAYGSLDVKDKWVMVLRFLPEGISAERRQYLNRFASLRYKAMEARDRGAKGLIVVSGPTSKVESQLVPLRFDAAMTGAGIPAISVTDAFAAEIFSRANKDLRRAQTELDKGEPSLAFELPGTTIGGHFSLSFDRSTGRNVCGRLSAGTGAEDIVVLGAHVDHLGRGGAGDSLARADEKNLVHHGADDNASGVAAMLEIAEWLAGRKASGEWSPERDLVLCAWSGEELGLYGSTRYVEALLDGAETLEGRVAAYINLDMVGRLDKHAVLQGVASSPAWKKLIERRNIVVGLPLKLNDNTYLPTDATPFYLKRVPILNAFTGAHPEYHTPRDTADRLSYIGMQKVAHLMALLTKDVTEAEAALPYVRVAPPKNSGGRRNRRVYLGTIPEYANQDVVGVQLSGVSAEGPAERAGIKPGDILIELAGQPLKSIYDYVKVLDGLKIGQTVSVKVRRGDDVLELSITPRSRD